MTSAAWHLQEFNKGLFDYLIATDDVHSAAHDRDGDDAQQDGAQKPPGAAEPAAPSDAGESLVSDLDVAPLSAPVPVANNTG